MYILLAIVNRNRIEIKLHTHTHTHTHIFKIRGVKMEACCCLRFWIFEARILFCVEILMFTNYGALKICPRMVRKFDHTVRSC